VAPTRHVAAFDFDGTISQRDTLGPFLASVCGRGAVYRALLVRSPALAAALVGIGQRDAEKERLCRKLLAGRTIEQVRDAGSQYAHRLVGDGAFREQALDDLARHRELGHEIVIVSASLDVYLDPLAPHLGVDHVISTSLEVDDQGHVTGRLLGGNVRGPEKARRLRAWLGPDPVELWAYGDSAGDRELLAMADHPTRVR
jgi:phosphatidylglycerophosphatase C